MGSPEQKGQRITKVCRLCSLLSGLVMQDIASHHITMLCCPDVPVVQTSLQIASRLSKTTQIIHLCIHQSSAWNMAGQEPGEWRILGPYFWWRRMVASCDRHGCLVKVVLVRNVHECLQVSYFLFQTVLELDANSSPVLQSQVFLINSVW